MTSQNVSRKFDLRVQLRARLKEISPERRAEHSAQARSLLSGQSAWVHAKSVLFYAPLVDEIDLLPLLVQGLVEKKAIVLLRFVAESGSYAAFEIEDFARDCAPGKFGILEPATHCAPFALNVLDLALVPGLGFDANGRRLGRGRGYYDRVLSRVDGIKCGVAFDEQIVREIPADPHDIQLNCILTPTQWLETSGRRPLLS